MADNFIEMKMEPKQLFRSIAGFKYKLHEAVGDIADNSVDAECSRIWIEVSREKIIIADDGIGMDKETLASAITPWANAEEYRKDKRGIYGIGLKSASFSLGSKLEIHTKAKNDQFYLLKMDQKELNERTNTLFPYSNDETPEFKKFKLKTGTVIVIRNVNSRKVTQPAIDKLKNEIGLMFFRLIEKSKITILVNSVKVDALNPILPDLKKGSPDNYYHSYGSKEIEFKKDNGDTAVFKVTAAHIGRGSFWSNADRIKYRYFLRKHVTADNEFSSGLLKLDEQGIYLMRNDRLITLGGWFGIVRSTTLLHHDVCMRIIIEYKSKDDDIIGVDHTKTKPDFIDALKDALRDQWLAFLVNDSDDRFRNEQEAIARERQKIADRELKARAMAGAKWAKKTASSARKAGGVDPDRKKADDDEEDNLGKGSQEKEEWIEVVKELPYKNLWSGQKKKDEEIIVYLAERHPAYASLYLEKDPDQRRKNLNFLFYNIALFEVDAHEFIEDLKPSERETVKKAFKEFRKFVSRRMAEIGED